MTDEASEATPPRAPSRRLHPWERALAGLLGAAGAGAGTAAVFITDNQAGTAGLLVLAIALLLMAIQGTPITRFGFGENAIEYALAERGQELIQQSQEAKTPDAADAYLDAAFRVSPMSALTPESRAATYETLLMRSLQDLAGEINVKRLAPDGGADFVVRTRADERIEVVAKYLGQGVGGEKQLRRLLDRSIDRAGSIPRLVVVNAPVGMEDRVRHVGSASVRVVPWNGPQDNPTLQSALEAMSSAPE
ncbi:hypothetical protein [Nocardia fluminea]|uniref:hypothetical protein n=1 Tax=Nocardia fluminea TaxID=134984 RepID=UPI0036649EF2